MERDTKRMPLVSLRNLAVLPGMLIHFDINRPYTIAAVEEAMHTNQEIFLIAQRDTELDEVDEENLYTVGCISVVKQLIKLPGSVLRVMVSGLRRGILEKIVSKEPFYVANVTYTESEEFILTKNERDAMFYSMKDLLDVYFAENVKTNKDIMKQMILTDQLERLMEQIAVQIPMTMQEKQSILEEEDFVLRYQLISFILTNEIEIIRIRKEIQNKVKERVDKNQREYLLREQLKVIREELGETNTTTDAEGYLETTKNLHATEQVKEKIRKEIERFKSVAGSTSESAVSRGYIETLLELPWDKESIDRKDITYAKTILDKEHYGLTKVKDRILEFLAVRTLTNKVNSPIVCLVGPPGTGKTSIAKSVAKALEKEYVRICLGGVRDEAEIRGHRRTYVGAMPGRLIVGLKSAGVKNPLMLLDEIDKMSSDFKGDTASALLEVLDAEQNSRFIDHYIEIPVDLSNVLFIATANTISSISKPLLDRMEIIEINSYTQNEKYHIATKHLVNKQIEKNGLMEKQISFSGKAIEKIIAGYTREAGVRTLERRIGEICRKVALELLESKLEDNKKLVKVEKGERIQGKSEKVLKKSSDKIKITDKNVHKYLGKLKYKEDKINKKPEIGIVRGLAYTSVGGDTLEIEVNTMNGKGNIELTGQLGDVMKESAKTGISYIRSVANKYNIAEKYFEEHDIHIHIPAGAVPKDGPSAGVSMATAVFSVITNKLVRHDVAMTGEITLRGRVLPIGGLKEKILAAKIAGIKMVIIPIENKSDIEELEEEITKDIDIKYVSYMEDILELALVE